MTAFPPRSIKYANEVLVGLKMEAHKAQIIYPVLIPGGQKENDMYNIW